MCEVMMDVASSEGSVLDKKVAEKIGHQSDRNLRKALLMLEAAAVQGNLATGQAVMTDWEQVVDHVARSMVEEQTPER
jgi:replication factor C subunit 3/5